MMVSPFLYLKHSQKFDETNPENCPKQYLILKICLDWCPMDQTQSPHCKHKQIILEINYANLSGHTQKSNGLQIQDNIYWETINQNAAFFYKHTYFTITTFTNDFIPNFDAMRSLNIQSMLSLTVNHIPKSYK